MKKVISLFLCAIMIFSISVFIGAAEAQETETHPADCSCEECFTYTPPTIPTTEDNIGKIEDIVSEIFGENAPDSDKVGEDISFITRLLDALRDMFRKMVEFVNSLGNIFPAE